MTRPIAALAAALVISACADVGDAPVAETRSLDTTAAPTTEVALPAGDAVPIDTAASTIEWTAAKVTRTHHGGFRTFSGLVYVDNGVVTGADVTADASSIYSDEDRLTQHLKSDDFFDVAVNPDVRVLVSQLTPRTDSAGATHTASGQITMHGVTNAVSFPVALREEGGSFVADADFIIDRQDWGLTYPGQPDDLVRDEVRIRLHIVAPAAAAEASAQTAP